MLSALVSSGLHAQRDASCPTGVFGIAAQVVKIDPPKAKLQKRLASGKLATVGEDDVICVGESMKLPADGTVRRVELYAQGSKKTLVPPDEFENQGGALRVTAQALNWIADVMPQIHALTPPPDKPRPTASRGAGDGTVRVQIRQIRLLADLPEQRIASGVRPVLSWREGAGPYKCVAMSKKGDPVWTSPPIERESSCTMSPKLEQAAQLLVSDRDDESAAWNVAFVPWSRVPRPDWLPHGDGALSDAEMAAWAAWLWRSRDAEWKLQALAMLDALAPRVWIAGYLRDNLLAESEPFRR